MRIWVTGATGQIGSRLCTELAREGHDVTVVGRRPAQSASPYEWVQWDMSRGSLDVRDIPSPEVVFHLAAQTSAYYARQDLSADVTTNVLGFVKLLDALRQTNSLPHVILAGAATEVRSNDSGIIRDCDPEEPGTFYDVGKIAQHLYLSQCGSEGWVDGTTIRLPNVYGGVGSFSSPDRGFLNTSIIRACTAESLNYYSDGDYIRDFLYVADAVSALKSAMYHREKVRGKIFLVGTGVGTRIQDALKEIARQAEMVTSKRVPVRPVFAPDGMYEVERRNTVVDSARFTEHTDWTSKVSLKDGIQRSIVDLQQTR